MLTGTVKKKVATSLTVYVRRERGQKQDFLRTVLNLDVDYLSSCLLALFLVVHGGPVPS